MSGPSRSRGIRPVGGSAWLIECADTDDAVGIAGWLSSNDAGSLSDVVPAMQTVLVVARQGAEWSARELVARAADASPAVASVADTAACTIEVDYDGEDLQWCADELGVSRDALIAAHLGANWRVAFIGFAPGFAYLTADDWGFSIPRLADPRPRVPAGSVAIADGFAGVYPGTSPGGWRLIGRTSTRIWDLADDPPTPLLPGTRVRFVRAHS